MTTNSDRRRINAPVAGTSAPVFARTVKEEGYLESLRPQRTRGEKDLRNICKFRFSGLSLNTRLRYSLSSFEAP